MRAVKINPGNRESTVNKCVPRPSLPDDHSTFCVRLCDLPRQLDRASAFKFLILDGDHRMWLTPTRAQCILHPFSFTIDGPGCLVKGQEDGVVQRGLLRTNWHLSVDCPLSECVRRDSMLPRQMTPVRRLYLPMR